MKTKLLLLLCVFALTFVNSQVKTTSNKAVITKTVVAYYQKSGQWSEWSGLIFVKEDKTSEMRFLKTTNQEVLIKRFWRDASPDPEDVSGELHTNKSCVGQKYLITYTTKMVSYTGVDQDGAQTISENVIVTFEPMGGDNINGASSKLYQNGELKAIAFGDRIYEYSSSGKKQSEKVIQNKNEVCRGTECVRTVVEKDGTIYTLVLPNVVDKSMRGKVEADEILKWEMDYQGKGQYKSRGITYIGDRQLAVMATLVYAWFQ